MSGQICLLAALAEQTLCNRRAANDTSYASEQNEVEREETSERTQIIAGHRSVPPFV